MNEQLSDTEIIKALERSGYLFESETAGILSAMGFFIETNQAIKDPFTNKSREIDIIAEYHKYIPEHSGKNANAKIKYVFEIKNNIYPVVLLTRYEFSPTLIFEESFKIAQAFPAQRVFHFNSDTDFTNKLCPVTERQVIFTQYCSFQRKKQNDDLMAIHPEELYTGLSKITQYTEEEAEAMEIRAKDQAETQKHYRNTLFLPVVLLNNDLYELGENEKNEPVLKSVESSKLIINYHYKNEPKSGIVYFVTKAGLKMFLKGMMDIEYQVQESMIHELNSGV